MLSRLTDIILEDNTQLQLYSGNLPQRYLHSNSKLNYESYRFAGERQLEQVQQNEVIVTIDTFAYRARHQDTSVIKRLKTGNYHDTLTNEMRNLKLVGVISNKNLYIIIVQANKKVMDIAPWAPLRVSGLSAAYRKIPKRFSSNENLSKSA